MSTSISAHTLKQWLHDDEEIALFDVGEFGQYGEGHLFYAVPLPFSELEIQVARLAPNRDVRVVLYDHGDGIAARAAGQLQLLGYTRVHVLEGGAPAWAQAGYTLFKGVNVPSKTFGELVEVVNHTPHITATELAARQASGEPLVLLDGRPLAEFRKMSIPGAVCCPNGELVLRLAALAPDPSTPVVINCAGRTRSIIGAQTLINLGVPNPVVALENGTQGWFLNDLQLDHGKQSRYPETRGDTPAIVASARALAERAGVIWINASQAASWATDTRRSLFLCDVRSPEEFAAGSLPGAQSTPGGQLQQATDHYVGVRNATLVLFDDDGVRAPTTASWLRQLGWQAFVLERGLDSGLAIAPPQSALPPALATIGATELEGKIRHEAVEVIDLRASQDFREAHIPGSRWSIRPRLPVSGQDPARPVVLVSNHAESAAWAAADLRAAGLSNIALLEDGLTSWTAAGLPVDSTPAQPVDADRIDHLFFTHERHSGNKAAATQYLNWELGLLAQLDEQELAAFHPLHA